MKIVNFQICGRFQLVLTFDDGVSGMVDLSDYAGVGVFKEWLKPGFFEQVKVSEFGALEWPHEIDLCPDALYMRVCNKHPDEVFPNLENKLAYGQFE